MWPFTGTLEHLPASDPLFGIAMRPSAGYSVGEEQQKEKRDPYNHAVWAYVQALEAYWAVRCVYMPTEDLLSLMHHRLAYDTLPNEANPTVRFAEMRSKLLAHLHAVEAISSRAATHDEVRMPATPHFNHSPAYVVARKCISLWKEDHSLDPMYCEDELVSHSAATVQAILASM